MSLVKKYISAGASVALLAMLSACAAEVGSDAWCADMKEKESGNWTANEASDFAKHCILK
ncbi:MAG: DUF3012 domain-containing protein [Gammaproteobacteria bacterium]|nr:DUF3012 domain-containing protein [Gammaproteobacteria bacterium]